MNVKIIAVFAVILIIVGVGTAVLSGSHATPKAQINASTYNSNQSSPTSGTQSTNTSKILFSSTQYYPYSYMIYPGPISQQARSALVGFNLTSTVLQNSTAKITLALTGSNQYQSIMLKPNYKLYLIETTFGDDAFNFDSSFGDDGFVVVDPKGYVA